jgi:hypothetical protein
MKCDRGPESGSLTIQTAIIILYCAILGAAALSLLAFSSRGLEHARREADASAARASLVIAVNAAMAAIEEDQSPESDSPLDAAYSITSLEGAAIKIQDASSFINPNWVRKGILEDTPLSALLKPGKSPSELQQYREDSGLSQDTEHYADYFAEDEAEKFLSPFSYPCISASDEFALRRLCLDATENSQAAESVFSAVQAQLKSGKAVDEAGLRNLLGVNYDSLCAVLTSQAQMNVNFLPEKILKAIVSYSAWAIPDSGKKWQSISLTRESSAISQETLKDILKLKADHPITGYLGVRTWFWRIETEKDGIRLEAIAARRLPFDPANPKKGLTLISVKEIKK